MPLGEIHGAGEEGFGGDSEELARVRPGVGAQQLAWIAVAHGLVARRADVDPALALVVVGQQWSAVEYPVAHVDLVGELVEHDIPPEPRVCRLASSGPPRDHQRSVAVMRLAVDCLRRSFERATDRAGGVALGH